MVPAHVGELLGLGHGEGCEQGNDHKLVGSPEYPTLCTDNFFDSLLVLLKLGQGILVIDCLYNFNWICPILSGQFFTVFFGPVLEISAIILNTGFFPQTDSGKSSLVILLIRDHCLRE